MQTVNQDEEVRVLKMIDQNVLCLINAWGEELLNEYYTGTDRHLYEVDMPDMYSEEDEDGDYPYPDAMQYFIITEYLARLMKADSSRRDPIMETNDGLHVWIRCGYGYGLYDDIARYFMK